MTDNTLVQLSIHCPRLQALVNLNTCTSDFVPVSACAWSFNPSMCFCTVPVPLWAHHRRWHQSSEQQYLRPRAPHCGGAGQLPPNHWCDPGAPEELPSSGAHWALRLSASHQGRHQTHPGQWKPNANHNRICRRVDQLFLKITVLSYSVNYFI